MLRVIVLPVLLVSVLGGLAGCGENDDVRASDVATPSESAEDFARRAFAEIDVAATCPELEKAWDTYLDPTTRAVVRRLVPCDRKALAATYPLESVRRYDDYRYMDTPRPDAVADADEILEAELDAPEPEYADSFTYEVFLRAGWLVLTTGAEHTLFNTTFDALDGCLDTKDGCRFSG
ncbi:hypothetical protein ASD84_20415 [Nocardioides sp. Root682]|nr:hypothetical protein ASD84_20415 [Nocardioides sp. Root682]